MFIKKLLIKTTLTLTLFSIPISLAQTLNSFEPIFPEQISIAIEMNTKNQIPELLKTAITENLNTNPPFIKELIIHSLNSNQIFIGTQKHKVDQYKSLDYIAIPISQEKFQSLIKQFNLNPHKNLSYNRDIYFIDNFIDNIQSPDKYFIGFRNNLAYITNDELILSDILLQPNPSTLHKLTSFQELQSFKPEKYFLNIYLNFLTHEFPTELGNLINNLSIWASQENNQLNIKIASKLDQKLQSIFKNFTPKLLNKISSKNLIGFISFHNLNQTILDLKNIFNPQTELFDKIIKENLTTSLTNEHLLTFHLNQSNPNAFPHISFISIIENPRQLNETLEKFSKNLSEQDYSESTFQFNNTNFKKFTQKSNENLQIIMGILDNLLIITNHSDLELILNSSNSIEKIPNIQNQLQKINSYSLLLNLINIDQNDYSFTPSQLKETIKTSKNLTFTLYSQNNHLITNLDLTTDINEFIKNLNLTLDPNEKYYDYNQDYNKNYNDNKLIKDRNCNFEDDNSIYSASELCYYGIIEGYKKDGKTYLKPNQPVTRAEFLKMLIAIQQHKGYAWLTVMPSSYFNDVPENSTDWFAPYIHKAKANNYIKGYPDNTFRPNNTITHAESYQLLFQATSNFVKPPNNFEIKHPNINSNDWYYTALKTIFYNFNYSPYKQINPDFSANKPITRKEAFDLLNDYLNY